MVVSTPSTLCKLCCCCCCFSLAFATQVILSCTTRSTVEEEEDVAEFTFELNRVDFGCVYVGLAVPLHVGDIDVVIFVAVVDDDDGSCVLNEDDCLGYERG